MNRSISRSLILLASGVLACSSGGSNPPEQPAPAAGAPAAGATGTADYAAWFAGEWGYEATVTGLSGGNLSGSWRITLVNGRWTGVVAPEAFPPSPIKTMTMNGPSFTFLVDFNGEEYSFRGRLENERTINGTVSKSGAQGRLTARKR